VQDVALFIVGKRLDNVWKLVVFHGSKSGYHPFVIVSSPETKKGDPFEGYDFGTVQRYKIGANSICSDERECLQFAEYESFATEYIWKTSRYEAVSIGD
jgi:hypothetical protein